MTTKAFDTGYWYKRLTGAGFTDRQAEVLIDGYRLVIELNAAYHTVDDKDREVVALRQETIALKQELRVLRREEPGTEGPFGGFLSR